MSREPWCPWCYGKEIDAHFVDNGFGMEQVCGYHCFVCQAQEFNQYTDPGNTTPEERRLGFLMGRPEIWRTARQRHSNYMLFMRRMFKEIEILLRLQDIDCEITDDEALRVCRIVGFDKVRIEQSLKELMKKVAEHGQG